MLDENYFNIAVERICSWESFSASPYYDSAKILTIGHGLTELNGHKIKENDVITEEESKQYVRERIENDFTKMKFFFDVHGFDLNSLNDNQIAAILVFIFNIGATKFLTSSVATDLVNNNFHKVPEDLLKWCKVTVNGQLQFCQGLYNRRVKEGQLFNSKDGLVA